jgi:hypothetical protein
VPRRVAAPEPALADDAIRLDPLTEALAPELGWVLDGDADTARFTRIPSAPDAAFLSAWLRRYERAWEDGTAAGFAMRDAPRVRRSGSQVSSSCSWITRRGRSAT